MTEFKAKLITFTEPTKYSIRLKEYDEELQIFTVSYSSEQTEEPTSGEFILYLERHAFQMRQGTTQNIDVTAIAKAVYGQLHLFCKEMSTTPVTFSGHHFDIMV